MKTAFESFDLIKEMAEKGNPNSVSDVGVGVYCILTAIKGAYLNVQINCKDFDDVTYVAKTLDEASGIHQKAEAYTNEIMKTVNNIIGIPN
jgi:glutamate formiminotransferase/formiminotetrahydrofolate cyclodeaminase